MPRHPTAAYVKALTLIDEKRLEDAYSLLDSVATDDLKETKPLKLLAKMQIEQKQFAQAVRTGERARKIDPHDSVWIVQLGKLYVKTEQKEKLLEIFEEVVKIDPDDLAPRKVLAKHYLDLGKHLEAERYARKGLEIDVLDAECQRIIIEDFSTWIASKEDLIISKLWWAKDSRSEQQLRDVRNLAATGCDTDYIVRWTTELGLLSLWQELQS